jgi:hydrogenase expression/formation protein HypE
MDQELPRPPRPFRLEAVLFDFDGTLTMPGALDFPAITRELGCPPDRFVLEYVESLPPGERRDQALAALENFELEAAARARPNAGAGEVVRGLRRHGLKVGVITRNGRPAIDRALANFDDLGTADFDVIVTRDDPYPPKPAPDGVLGAAAAMAVDPTRLLVVGDSILDALAGRAAGAVTAFLTNRQPAGLPLPAEAAACDFVVASLDELDRVARLGLPLAQGKLPADLLAAFLGSLGPTDPSVIIGATIGEDVAALDVSGHEVLVAHCDPITLTTANLGRQAVIVNANDIATSGADPRWLLATVMLPPGSSTAEALHLLGGLSEACRELDVAPVGGHSEVTAAVTQPLVAGTMLGLLRRSDLRDKRSAHEGDRLILTKALAVEGTALLANELAGRLTEAGMGQDELARCRALAGLLSIVPEARIAATYAGVHAMHDITEGGLATALVELSVACGREIAVERHAIPVYEETTRLCTLLGVDPLGLIGSGSLLICCAPEQAEALLEALRAGGIAATDIGVLGQRGVGVRASACGRPVAWPVFAVDEAARLLAAP